MEWKNVNINKQNISYSGDWSTLIKCPHNSRWDGYSFWHTNKLIREGRHTNALSIGYNDEFKFKLIKYGKGKYNKDKKVEEIEINAAEFEEMFGIMNDNIKSAEQTYKLDIFETHKPEMIAAVTENINEELLDNE